MKSYPEETADYDLSSIRTSHQEVYYKRMTFITGALRSLRFLCVLCGY